MVEQGLTGRRKTEMYIIKTASFFKSRYHIIILRWRALCFPCSCTMIISEIVADLISLCYLASELCAIEGANEEMTFSIPSVVTCN
jgi:hypothetical protein